MVQEHARASVHVKETDSGTVKISERRNSAYFRPRFNRAASVLDRQAGIDSCRRNNGADTLETRTSHAQDLLFKGGSQKDGIG